MTAAMAAPDCCCLRYPAPQEETVFLKPAFFLHDPFSQPVTAGSYVTGFCLLERIYENVVLPKKFALHAYKANLLKGKKHRKEHNYTAQP